MRNRIDEWRFSGAKAMTANINNAAAVDQSANYPDLIRATGGSGVVRVPATAHGFLASADMWRRDEIVCVFIKGSTNYNGMWPVVAVAANTIDILAPYVAETFAGGGAETLQPGFHFDHEVEVIGFDLHLGEACATAESLTIALDSHMGAAFDTTIYTLAMNTVQNASINFEELATTQREIDADDKVIFAWANANSRTWGLTIKTRRRV